MIIIFVILSAIYGLACPVAFESMGSIIRGALRRAVYSKLRRPVSGECKSVLTLLMMVRLEDVECVQVCVCMCMQRFHLNSYSEMLHNSHSSVYMVWFALN